MHLVEQGAPKLVSWVRYPVVYAEDLRNGTWDQSSLALDVDGWLQE